MPEDKAPVDDAQMQMVRELIELIKTHRARTPDPVEMSQAYVIGMASLLAEIIRGAMLLQPDMDTFLSDVCRDIYKVTLEFVRNRDEIGDLAAWYARQRNNPPHA
jgi:hypothetical protein